MSDDNENGNGGRDRATVAVAVEKIDGLREFTRAEFGEVKDRIGKLEGLPERVVRLETTQGMYADLPGRMGGAERVLADHEQRLLTADRERDAIRTSADREKEAARASRSFNWPTIGMAALAIIATVLGYIFK